MVGLGIEYAFAQNWSAKVEYSYLDFGTERISFTSNGTIPGHFRSTTTSGERSKLSKSD